jgi:hypothetical protein
VRRHGTQPAQDGTLVERSRCLGRQISALGVGATQATSGAEVVDGGQRAVHGTRRRLRDRLQVER